MEASSPGLWTRWVTTGDLEKLYRQMWRPLVRRDGIMSVDERIEQALTLLGLEHTIGLYGRLGREHKRSISRISPTAAKLHPAAHSICWG